ncbi:MAG: hypothetical protein AB7G40_07680 [Hyphomonadaceae bacterium]
MYFVPINASGETLGVWKLDGQTAVKLGVHEPLKKENAHTIIGSGETLERAMSRQLRAWFNHGAPCRLEEMKLPPGRYFPRMARPSDQHPGDSPGMCPQVSQIQDEVATIRGQLGSLKVRLESICQTVHPRAENFGVYGHEIRNLLILASTEVELQWKAVLAANGVSKSRYTTNDFVKLHDAMRLKEYAISLPQFPWLAPLRPFDTWNTTGRPTQDLPWYDAYNAVKHDREANFSKARLDYALNSVAACAIMLIAQVGLHEAFRWTVDLGYFFSLSGRPKWHPTEVYTLDYENGATGWVASSYPF